MRTYTFTDQSVDEVNAVLKSDGLHILPLLVAESVRNLMMCGDSFDLRVSGYQFYYKLGHLTVQVG